FRATHGFFDVRSARRERLHFAAEDAVELAQAIETDIYDRDARAEADRHFRGIRSDDAAADDHHVRGQHARHTAEKHAASAVRLVQVIRADVHGHAARDFRHRREERKRALAL